MLVEGTVDGGRRGVVGFCHVLIGGGRCEGWGGGLEGVVVVGRVRGYDGCAKGGFGVRSRHVECRRSGREVEDAIRRRRNGRGSGCGKS